MGRVRFHISVSLDGFVAGEHPSAEHPLGIGGMQLHEWLFALAAWRAPHGIDGGDTNASSRVVEEGLAGVGAVIMGRNMFGGGPGPWPEDAWTGWWGTTLPSTCRSLSSPTTPGNPSSSTAPRRSPS